MRMTLVLPRAVQMGVDAADAFFEGDVFGFGDEELGVVAVGLEFG